MTIVDTATGEVLDAEAAEARAVEISTRLEELAADYEAVMPLMREAINLRDDIALGYNSPGEYLSTRFGRSLDRLGIDLRREVSRELADAGLSARAIAPIVGVTEITVRRDLAAAATYVAPGETARPRPPIIGLDGKTYSATRVPARLTDEEWAEQQHKAALEKTIRDGLGYISDAIQFLEGGTQEGDRFVREYWPHHDKYLTGIRAITTERVDAAIAYLKTIRKAIA